MKIRNLMLVALAASMTFVACSKDDGTTGAPEDTQLKSVTVKLPNISKADTRATGDAIAANSKVSLKNYKVFFLDAAGKVQTVPPYDDKPQQVYFSSDAADSWKVGELMTYHFLPAATAKVVVVGNMGDVEYTAVDGAEDTPLDVLNDGGSDLDGSGHPYYPLYGDSGLTLKDGEDDAHHANVYTASVTLAPRVARMEVYGFSYELDPDAEPGAQFTFDKVELAKIALANYYTTYDFVSMEPKGVAVTAPASSAEMWDWIDGQRTPWANGFASFELTPDQKKFANGTEIVGDANNGEGAKGIVTYGLTNVKDKVNNPELLLSFYGVKGGVKTPLYLHGKFAGNDKDAFEAGKIYRVFFPIYDGLWDQPERCVELTVDVAQWVVVPVTPEF